MYKQGKGMSIETIAPLEVLDSRGNPTICTRLTATGGESATAMVPSGASTGSKEALELRDGDQDRYLGKGVTKAVNNINSIANKLKNFPLNQQSDFDNYLIELDGTENKSNIGANATLGLSLAYARLSALASNVPLYTYFANLCNNQDLLLPMPMMNIINGGSHADNNIDIQEFMILPIGAPSFKEAIRYGAEVFHSLKSRLKKAGLNTAVGDEGGFAPNLTSNKHALDEIMEAIQAAGFKPGIDLALGLDLASSEFYQNGKYALTAENRELDHIEFTELLSQWVNDYPIISIEDPMHEDDWDGWGHITSTLGNKVQIVGDDLFVTNAAILEQGIKRSSANSILIKLNQIGTVTETLNAIELAKRNNFTAVISHRSGETEDTTIADLAVGTASGQIKTGSLCRTDRIAKYNRLLIIEQELGNKAKLYKWAGGLL